MTLVTVQLSRQESLKAFVKVRGEMREMVFLTNNFSWSGRTIAELYRARWGIETFFKEIKQTCLFICKRVNVALPEETFITAETIWFVIAYMPASTVGYTLLTIPPRIRREPRSTNSFTPNAAYPFAFLRPPVHTHPALPNPHYPNDHPQNTPCYFIDSHHPFPPKGALLKTIGETLGNYQFSQFVRIEHRT